MPIYEYHCSDCGRTFEKLQPLEAKTALCPKCGKEAHKVMSASVGYVIKEASHHGGGRSARDSGSCCGEFTPCENPKRCCTK